MALLHDSSMRDIHDMVVQHHFIDQICPCVENFSARILLGHSRPFENRSILVKCSMMPTDSSEIWPAFIPGLGDELCQHAKSPAFWMAVSNDIWESDLANVSEALIFNVLHRPWAFEPFVDARVKGAVVMKLASQNPMSGGSRLTCAEMCTGAFSGWSHSIFALNQLGFDIHHKWGIDHDYLCCKHFAMTHGFEHVRANGKRDDEVSFDEQRRPPVFQTDIRESWFLHSVKHRDVDAVMMSAPCQPWTGATTEAKGLNRKDGLTLLWCFARCKLIKPRMILLENVSNIVQHQHWRYVLQVLRWAGYIIVWAETLKLQEIFPQSRNRLLLVAVQSNLWEEVSSLSWISWPQMPAYTLRTFRCIMTNPECTGECTHIDKEVLEMYVNPKLAPADSRKDLGKNISVAKMRAFRFKTLDDLIFPCVLANYTKAHDLPLDLLQDKGLFGGILIQDANPRFLTSAEIYMLMGGVSTSWLPESIPARIHVLGNCISVPHAAITILNAMRCIRGNSDDIDVQEIFSKVIAQRITCDQIVVRILHEGMFIGRRSVLGDEIPPTIPIVSFVQMHVHTPTETYRFWMDTRVPIMSALRGIVGVSMPAKLTFQLHDKLKIPIEENDTVDTCGTVVLASVPSIICLDDDKMKGQQNPFIVALTSSGPIVFNRPEKDTCEDVERFLHDFFPEMHHDFEKGMKIVTSMGLIMDRHQTCHDMITLAFPVSPGSLSRGFLDELQCKIEMGGIFLKTYWKRVLQIMTHFHRLGIGSILHSIGWMMVLGPPPEHGYKMAQLIILPQPGVLSARVHDVRVIILTRLFIAMLPESVEEYEHHIHAVVKLWHNKVWEGLIALNATLSNFLDVWTPVCDFLQFDCPLSVVLKGRAANPACTFREFLTGDEAMLPERNASLRIHLITSLRGGGNKNDDIIDAKNSIAVFLLSEGADLQQTSHFADVAVRSAGILAITRLLGITNPNEKLEAFKNLAQSLHIRWPDFPKQDREITKNVKQAMVRKGMQPRENIKAENFQLVPECFVNEDGSKCDIRHDIQPNVAGIALLDCDAARPWLQDFKIISQDELAICVLGHRCPTSDTKMCNPVQVSAQGPNAQPVILQCCLHNLGAKKVQVKAIKDDKVTIASSAVISITIFKDEIVGYDWDCIMDHPVRYALENLNIDDNAKMVSPPWGRSWINCKGKCDPINALSFQCHTRVPLGKLEQWLRQSGRNGIYIVAKGDDSALDTKFMVIWLEQSAIELAKTAVDHPNHVGIVRNSRPKGDVTKVSRGLRFKVEHFKQAWKDLKPSEDCPDAVPIKWLYKISPTPIAATLQDVKEWLKLQSWTARPIKALGPKTWLIGSEDMQCLSFLSWNGHSILIKSVSQAKSKDASPILAGNVSRSSTDRPNIFKSGNPHDDPWAQYKPGSDVGSVAASNHVVHRNPVVASRPVEAPIELRFKNQDAKIDDLTNQIQQLKQKSDDRDNRDQEFRQNVKDEFVVVREEVKKQLNTMTQSFDTSLERALAKQDRSISASIQELKCLMLDRANPAKKAKAGPTKSDGDLRDGEHEL